MDQPNLAAGEELLYLCAQCNAPVFLVEQIIYKPCAHKESPVLANLSAILRGTSTVD